jgi:hypothetical protein
MDTRIGESAEPSIGAETVEVPAPTAAPLVCAFGVALIFAGLATSGAISGIGAILAGVGVGAWLRRVLPHSEHERLAVDDRVVEIVTRRTAIERVPDAPDNVRATLPLEIYPISAGVHGGIGGGIAMAVLAVLYGVLSGHGFWYPINLLAAGVLPSASLEQLSSFYPTAFFIALAIHSVTSLLVGVLYGALLPMMPRRPIVLGGLVAPLIWSGLLYSSLALINPVLAGRIDWPWFVASQFGFGVVAGLVVSRRERIATLQPLPWRVRAGVEATGLRGDSPDKGQDHE